MQKGTYFLQEMVGVPTEFEFILYKHGPFSFDLRDELAAMRADGFVSLRVQDPSYGPSIAPEQATASRLKEQFPKTLRRHEPAISFVAERLGNRPVVELDRFATAFFVSKEMERSGDERARAEQVHRLKPHIPLDEASEAACKVDAWRREAETLNEA